MRPIRLEIEGLRSFRDRQEIDFTGRDYVAIIGDTGAGKSSILEGITFALYGRTTFSGQGHQELLNASSTALRVVYTFDVGGEHWEVARTLRRAASGKVGSGTASLRRVDGDGVQVEAYEGSRVVNARITALLGLNDEAFLRTVVLPQGQFSRLLVDDDQSVRSSVLRQIWRTDELSAAGTLAEDAMAGLGSLQGRAQQALAFEPEDPGGHLVALDAETGRCSTELAAARGRQREATDAASAVEEAARRIAQTERIASRLATWDGDAALRSARAIEAAARTSTAVIAETEQLLADARAAVAAVPGDSDGHSVAEIATFAARLGSLPDLAEQRDAAHADAGRARRELIALDERLSKAAAALTAATGELEALQAGRAELSGAERAAASALEPARMALGEARRAIAAVTEAEAGLRGAETTCAEANATVTAARDTHAKVRAVREGAAARLETARRGAVAAEAAHGLHSGEPCPVCDRGLPDGWVPPAAPELDAARDAFAAADAALDQAKADVVAGEARARQADGAVLTARRRLMDAEDLATTSHRGASVFLGHPPDLARTDDELLAGLHETITNARVALEAHDATLGQVRERHARLAGELAGAEATRNGTAKELDAALDRSAQAASRYAEQVEQLPLPLRPVDEGPTSAIAEHTARVIRELDQRRAVLDTRERERARLRRDVDTLVSRRRSLDEARRTEIHEPADRLWSAMLQHRPNLDRACEDLAASVELPAAGSRPAFEALVDAVGLVTRCTDQLSAVAARVAGEARASSHTARAVLARLAGELQLDQDGPEAVLAAALARSEDAAVEHRNAHNAAETFRRRMPAVAALRAASDALDDHCLALGDLVAALRGGAFPKWLTLRRSRNLLVHASRLLSEMTAGTYAFADLDDEDSQWFVFDSDNGQPRSPSSLSGGEKFVASLALSLGMVEMMGRQGDRIESLFLDEGFGALDRTNLDAAVEALGSVAASGRVVAVITHLRAVAEQIDNVLSVTRGPGGTRTAWLSRSERQAFAEGGLSVPSGLLD